MLRGAQACARIAHERRPPPQVQDCGGPRCAQEVPRGPVTLDRIAGTDVPPSPPPLRFFTPPGHPPGSEGLSAAPHSTLQAVVGGLLRSALAAALLLHAPCKRSRRRGQAAASGDGAGGACQGASLAPIACNFDCNLSPHDRCRKAVIIMPSPPTTIVYRLIDSHVRCCFLADLFGFGNILVARGAREEARISPPPSICL